MAPATGAKFIDPLMMFTICAASMLLTLYFCIKYTKKLFVAPLIARLTPKIHPSKEGKKDDASLLWRGILDNGLF
jgi:hypothetical protein